VTAYLRHHRQKLAKEAQYRSELEEQVRLRTSELHERNTELVNITDQLRLASLTDSLTGLKNRRYLDEFIHPEVAQVDRLVRDRSGRDSNDPMPDIFPGLFFMMIDLDGFKLINDNYGHHAGDQALLQVCEVLTRCCRSSDNVIRWGGDEFLVVGHGSNRSSIEKLAERIRSELATHQYRLEEDTFGRLSGSIGISVYPFVCANSDSLSWERVVTIADRAAYIAKENQRNAWVGIYPGPKAVSIRALESISDRLDELCREGVIEIGTSIEKDLSVFGQKRKSVSA
jgi:diguanylate cyclase (GGDEF)-like protein